LKPESHVIFSKREENNRWIQKENLIHCMSFFDNCIIGDVSSNLKILKYNDDALNKPVGEHKTMFHWHKILVRLHWSFQKLPQTLMEISNTKESLSNLEMTETKLKQIWSSLEDQSCKRSRGPLQRHFFSILHLQKSTMDLVHLRTDELIWYWDFMINILILILLLSIGNQWQIID